MSEGTPYVGFSNETLDRQPKVRAGMFVACKKCGESHALEGCTTTDGQPSDLLLFYKCGEQPFLGAVAGRAVVDVKADVSGRVDFAEAPE